MTEGFVRSDGQDGPVHFSPPVAALLCAGALALGVLLGWAAGPFALALCVPGALLAASARSRALARERRLEALTREDPLTGLGNVRLLRDRMAYEIVRHQRHGRPLAVVALDLDGFKGVNDRLGHAAGDEVLRAVGKALARTVRVQDTVVRQGGDEFCVVAPETGRREAERLMARLREAVAGAVSGLSGLDASFGAAILPEDGKTPGELLAEADVGVAEAKSRAGRRPPRRAAA